MTPNASAERPSDVVLNEKRHNEWRLSKQRFAPELASLGKGLEDSSMIFDCFKRRTPIG
jgi:hypothetical protein